MKNEDTRFTSIWVRYGAADDDGLGRLGFFVIDACLIQW